MSVLTLEAKLERTDSSTPWGFRMQGGKDFSSPLTIQKVNPGSLAAKCGLQVGDIILKIGARSTEDLRHKDAQSSILDSGNHLDLLIQRGGAPGYDKFNNVQVNSTWNAQPINVTAAPLSSQNFNSAPRPFGSQAPVKSSYETNLSLQTSNLSLASGAPQPAYVPPYKPVPTPSYQPPPPAPAPAPVSFSAPKPWAPAAPVTNATPRPFGEAPKPTGQGATRGKKGDAAMNPAALPTAGRIPLCSSCNMPIRGPFVTALGKCWCPDHFICANPQCGTKLLDIGFVEEGGFLYCERDYAIHFAPHCEKCGRAVIGECVNALQKSYHPECFLCAQCKQPIGGTKFHIEDGKFYCEQDWASMFQTMCSGCNFPVEPGDRWVEAMGKNFHSECFNCSTCQVNLEGQQFCAKGGKAYCKKHAR